MAKENNRSEMNNDYYVFSFSGGRTSAYMVEKYRRLYPNHVIIFCNTGKEKPQTLDFVHQCDKLWGMNIIWLEYDPDSPTGYKIVTYETASRNGEPFRQLCIKRKFVPNRVARFCTQELKIRVMKKFCQIALGWKHWTNLVGIRYDEPKRWSKSESVTRNEVFEVEHPLVKSKVIKKQILQFWENMSFDLKLKQHEGNCDLCFLKGLKKKQMILRDDASIADWWAETEEIVNGRFHPDYTIRQMRDFTLKQKQLFEIDDSIDCFCNVD